MGLRTEPTYRVFSTKKEATYGSAIALGSAVPIRGKHKDNVIWQAPGDIITDKDEYTGHPGITERTIRRWLVDFTHESRLLPHDAILFTALLLGGISSAQLEATAAYRHDLTPQAAVEMLSATMWQGNPLTGNRVIPGIGCSQRVITVDPNSNGGFATLAATLMGDGSMASGVDISAVALPSGEAYLAAEDFDVLVGGTFDGADVTNGVSIKSKLRKATSTLKNGAKREYQVGGDGNFADALKIPDVKLEDKGVIECEINPSDTTELMYLNNETEQVVEFRVVGATADGAYNFTISDVFPVSRVTVAEIDRDAGIHTAKITFVSQKDPSANDYPEIFSYGINLLTEYLQAV